MAQSRLVCRANFPVHSKTYTACSHSVGAVGKSLLLVCMAWLWIIIHLRFIRAASKVSCRGGGLLCTGGLAIGSTLGQMCCRFVPFPVKTNKSAFGFPFVRCPAMTHISASLSPSLSCVDHKYEITVGECLLGGQFPVPCLQVVLPSFIRASCHTSAGGGLAQISNYTVL